MKSIVAVAIFSAGLLLSGMSNAADSEYALSEDEAAALKLGRALASKLARTLAESGDPEKLAALDKMNELALIRSFLVSKTLVVPVSHCQRTDSGDDIQAMFDDWIERAKDDLRNGYEIIKDGYEGLTYDEMNQGTIDKISELEAEYSSLAEADLVEQCAKVRDMIAVFLHGYE